MSSRSESHDTEAPKSPFVATEGPHLREALWSGRTLLVKAIDDKEFVKPIYLFGKTCPAMDVDVDVVPQADPRHLDRMTIEIVDKTDGLYELQDLSLSLPLLDYDRLISVLDYGLGRFSAEFFGGDSSIVLRLALDPWAPPRQKLTFVQSRDGSKSRRVKVLPVPSDPDNIIEFEQQFLEEARIGTHVAYYWHMPFALLLWLSDTQRRELPPAHPDLLVEGIVQWLQHHLPNESQGAIDYPDVILRCLAADLVNKWLYEIKPHVLPHHSAYRQDNGRFHRVSYSINEPVATLPEDDDDDVHCNSVGVSKNTHGGEIGRPAEMNQPADGDAPEHLQFLSQLMQDLHLLTAHQRVIYRGECLHFPNVSSSLYRKLEAIRAQRPRDEDNAHLLSSLTLAHTSAQLLRQARQYTHDYDDFEVMASLQHLGGATNYIDFTSDLYVALYFACAHEPESDGRIIALPEQSWATDIRIHRPSMPREQALAQKSVLVEAREGLIRFSRVHCLRVPGALKSAILSHLKRHHGIDGSSVYRDITGMVRQQDEVIQHALSPGRGRVLRVHVSVRDSNGIPVRGVQVYITTDTGYSYEQYVDNSTVITVPSFLENMPAYVELDREHYRSAAKRRLYADDYPHYIDLVPLDDRSGYPILTAIVRYAIEETHHRDDSEC